MVIFSAFVSLGVDVGRMQLIKTELQQAADASARYGAMGLKNVLDSTSAAQANACAVAAQNTADGTPVILDPQQDVELVNWNAVSKTYTVVNDPLSANAVRVTARRTMERGNATALVFGRLIGMPSCDAKATAICILNAGASADIDVAATSNPFLAGMPNGSSASLNNPHNSPDYAPAQSPQQASLSLSPGSTLTFDGVNGGANNYHTAVRYTADGNTTQIISNSNGSENGIANMIGAPINSLVGVFLGNNSSAGKTPPTSLDFTTTTSRDFTTLSPKLRQIFFIGDGRTSSGEVQYFQIPTGATRLFVGTWDGYEWNNNVGSFTLTVHARGDVTLVR
jgi:Flp pilus assembly protein TadG